MKRLRLFLVTLVFLLATAATSSAYVIGDVDDDGVVRMNDALLVMRYIAGTTFLSPDQRFRCDMTWALWQNNPGCDFLDATLILSVSTGHL